MGIIMWLLLGLAAGAIAKYLHPGPDPGGTLATMGIGVAGSFVGGFLMSLVGLGGGGMIWSLITAVLGAFLLLFGYRKFQSRKSQ